MQYKYTLIYQKTTLKLNTNTSRTHQTDPISRMKVILQEPKSLDLYRQIRILNHDRCMGE